MSNLGLLQGLITLAVWVLSDSMTKQGMSPAERLSGRLATSSKLLKGFILTATSIWPIPTHAFPVILLIPKAIEIDLIDPVTYGMAFPQGAT